MIFLAEYACQCCMSSQIDQFTIEFRVKNDHENVAIKIEFLVSRALIKNQ